MDRSVLCLSVLVVLSAGVSAGPLRLQQPLAAVDPPPPTELFFEQAVDHFNYEDSRTFMEKYLLSEAHWMGSGPLLFYSGNEAPIETFYDNSGFLFELAQDFKALVVFAEHRYYGESLPFGSSSFHPGNIGYLMAEQALADYAVLIEKLKGDYKITKVITFGGSYGGMLSAWFRFKYPNVVDGALAASAPILDVANLTSPTAFFQAVTQDFERVDSRCPKYVREAFVQIMDLANQGKPGLEVLTEKFKLCSPLTADKVDHLMGWVRVSFTNLAMADYPYPASFLAPLPAYPVSVSCHSILNSEDRLEGLRDAAGLFYNGTTGALKCYNITEEYIECADPTGCSTGPAAIAEDYQACTEMTLQWSTNNVTDMFPPAQFDPSTHCKDNWATQPRNGWMSAQFWGMNISSTSNIIFSNGNLDPWRVGGILESVSESIIAITVEGGAHHLDLRSSNPDDPPAVTRARQKERDIIEQWLKEK